MTNGILETCLEKIENLERKVDELLTRNGQAVNSEMEWEVSPEDVAKKLKKEKAKKTKNSPVVSELPGLTTSSGDLQEDTAKSVPTTPAVSSTNEEGAITGPTNLDEEEFEEFELPAVDESEGMDFKAMQAECKKLMAVAPDEAEFRDNFLKYLKTYKVTELAKLPKKEYSTFLQMLKG